MDALAITVATGRAATKGNAVVSTTSENVRRQIVPTVNIVDADADKAAAPTSVTAMTAVLLAAMDMVATAVVAGTTMMVVNAMSVVSVAIVIMTSLMVMIVVTTDWLLPNIAN